MTAKAKKKKKKSVLVDFLNENLSVKKVSLTKNCQDHIIWHIFSRFCLKQLFYKHYDVFMDYNSARSNYHNVHKTAHSNENHHEK